MKELDPTKPLIESLQEDGLVVSIRGGLSYYEQHVKISHLPRVGDEIELWSKTHNRSFQLKVISVKWNSSLEDHKFGDFPVLRPTMIFCDERYPGCNDWALIQIGRASC